MTTTIIVLAVIAFLVVDGMILYLVLRGRKRAADHAAIAVPGEAALGLAPGLIKLTYQEFYKAASTSSGEIDFEVPEELDVSVISPQGEALEIKGPGFRGMGSSKSTGLKWSRSLIGTAEIAEAGQYRVVARGELANAVEPQLLVGR